MPRFARLATLLMSLGVLLPGCGSGGNAVKVTGKLSRGGVKYVPPEGQKLSMAFLAIEAKDELGKPLTNEPFLATIDADSESFSVPGRDGYGIPPGKYRVAVTQRMTREAFEATRSKGGRSPGSLDRETDMLRDQFSPEKSPILREIKAATHLSIDLEKPTATDG